MCPLPEQQVIKIWGLGGNFQLVNFLAFYASRTIPEKTLVIGDGGFYKLKHMDHELFGNIINKSLDAKNRLLKVYPNLKVQAVPYFIGTERSINSILPEDAAKEHDNIFLCFDNNASIRAVSIRCSKLDNVVLIVSGIDGVDILVQNYIKVDGIELMPPIHVRNPFVASPKDEMPSELLKRGCVDEVRGDRPNLFSLMMAGSLSLCSFYSIMEHRNSGNIHKFDVVNINFNIQQMKMRIEHLSNS